MRWVVAACAFVLSVQPLLADPVPRANAKPACLRVIAGDVSARELKVVGVVKQEDRRRLLLIDASRRGYFVAPGECAGRERVPFDTWLPSPIALTR